MKKVIIITYSIFMFSCSTNESLDISNFETDKIMSDSFIITNNNDNDDLRKKLELYSYTIGRVLLKHPDSRVEILNHISNNVLDLNVILSDNAILKTDFLYELNHLRLNEYGINDPTGGPEINAPQGIKPRITINGDHSPIDYDLISNEIENEILSSNYSDCLEIYVASPISFDINYTIIENGNSSIIHITPHPLSDRDFPNGYSLSNNINLGDYGYNTLFNNIFLATHSRNVIVIRPVRNNTCSYNNVDVIDFTSYYSN